MPFSDTPHQITEAEAASARDADTVFQILTGHWKAQTVRAAADLRIADHLAAGARTADEVARLESSDPRTTYRLMRACVSLGLLSSDGHGTFALTGLGEVLRGEMPGSLREAALAQSAHGHWQSWELLPEAVRAGEDQTRVALGTDIFRYFAANPEEASLFNGSMANMTAMVTEDVVGQVDLGKATHVVDVGGASGSLLLALLRSHPEVRGQVLDLPHVLEEARKAATDAGVANRFSALSGDFFDSVPEADYYLLKFILHDWQDEECVRILRNCHAAAHPGARALVVETLVGEESDPGSTTLLDMNMLALSPGQERSLDEFDALFASAGWQRIGLRSTRWMYSLIEIQAV